MDELAAEGATPAQVARDTDVLITMLLDSSGVTADGMATSKPRDQQR